MDEIVFYIGQGDPTDKHSQESYSYVTSLHTSKQYASFRQSDSHVNGTGITGTGPGERVFCGVPNKALIHVYSWGKEGVDQRIPVSEELSCLTLINHPAGQAQELQSVTSYRVPWLLAGGSKSGKLYIWELSSGNLLCVKDAHYQGITVVKASSCGMFLVTGGEDARCIVWNLAELISIYDRSSTGDDTAVVKPYWQITDNTLPITDVLMNEAAVLNDLKLYTSSRDSTVRIYDVMTKSCLTTFILPDSVECITRDPANRALYVGLSNGLIRTIPLYTINPHTSVLESVGGMNKIVTVDQDPNLTNTFVAHQQQQQQQQQQGGEKDRTAVTKLAISLDGTNIISGDTQGRVFVSDVVTKQVVKTFTPCNSTISYIAVDTVPNGFDLSGNVTSTGSKDKKHRMIPNFKRVLASTNPEDHQVFLDIPGKVTTKDDDFDAWLNRKQLEELEFKNLSGISSTVKQLGNGASNSELEEKLQKVSQAYTELRTKHEELIKEHAKLLDKL